MVHYESTRTVESKTRPGVRFSIRRMSFGNRIELLNAIRDAARQLEFLEAGETPGDKLAAALSAAEVDGIYLRWGLAGIQDLRIDGVDADTEALIDRGPEELCREIVAEVRHECGLSEDERKN